MTQLEPLQSLFKNRVFVIPDYQRGYAWEADQRQDLLNDLEDLAEVSAGKAHYTGTVVFHRGNHDSVFLSGTKYDVVDIVDGQQRITTIAVLLSVIVKVLQGLAEEEYTETAAVLRGEYLERKSTQQNLVRLRLNGNADAFFSGTLSWGMTLLQTRQSLHTKSSRRKT